MSGREFFQRLWRRGALLPGPFSLFRLFLWRLRGAVIGRGTRLPSLLVTWPHQVRLGRDCRLQPGIFFNYDYHWRPGPSILIGDRVFIGRNVEFNIQERLEVGSDSLIAADCVFVDHDHGTIAGVPMHSQATSAKPIRIGSNVWLGAHCIVLKGVAIGDNAVIGAGSVVTHDIPGNEIWAGHPARRLRAIGS